MQGIVMRPRFYHFHCNWCDKRTARVSLRYIQCVPSNCPSFWLPGARNASFCSMRWSRSEHENALYSRLSMQSDGLEALRAIAQHSSLSQLSTAQRSHVVQMAVSSVLISSCLLRFGRYSVSILVLSRAFRWLRSGAAQPLHQIGLSPHADLALTSFLLRSDVLCLIQTKFSTRLSFIYCCQSRPQHLQSHVFPEQPSANVDLCYHSIVLITPVDVRAYPAIVNQVDEPLMGFFGVWLRFPAPVCEFWCIHSSESYV
jgi:hypothetical protein